MYTLYVDGGGTKEVSTYFSYLCPETQERKWSNKQYIEYNPIRMKRFKLVNLAPELLPSGCSIYDGNGNQSSNLSEYAALYYGLQRFIEICGYEPVTIYQDSEIVVCQVNTKLDWLNSPKVYECKSPHLIPWLDAVASIWHDGINLKWVGREEIVRVLGH